MNRSWFFGKGKAVPGVILGIVIYMLISKMFKDNKKLLNVLDTDTNLMILDIEKIKKLRNGQNANLTFVEKHKIRSYFISSVIKEEQKDKIERANEILPLLSMEKLTKEGFLKLILNNKNRTEQEILQSQLTEMPIEKGPKKSVLIEKPKIVEEVKEKKAKALPPWWIELPYICILTKKGNGAVYMVDVGLGQKERYAVIGFEDPLDANITYKMTSEKTRHWGVPALIQQLGGGGAQQQLSQSISDVKNEDGDEVEMIWFTPKEFKDFLLVAEVDGTVIPSGVLNLNQNPNEREIILKIREICTSIEWGIMTSMTNEKSKMKERLDLIRRPKPDPFLEEIAEGLTGQKIVNDNNGNGASMTREDIRDINKDMINYKNEDEILEPSKDVFNEMETNYEKTKDKKKWWTALELIYVPMIKKRGEESGGSIQLNISFDPNKSMYKTIGFESETDAKHFAGIFAMLVGSDVLVGIKKMTPVLFTVEAENTTLVLAERTLDMTKDMTKEDLIQAIMIAENRSIDKKPNPINLKNNNYTEKKEIPKMELDDEMEEALEQLTDKIHGEKKLDIPRNELLDSFRNELSERLGQLKDDQDLNKNPFSIDFGTEDKRDKRGYEDFARDMMSRLDKKMDILMQLNKIDKESDKDFYQGKDDIGNIVNSEGDMENLLRAYNQIKEEEEEEMDAKLGEVDEDGIRVIYPKNDDNEPEDAVRGIRWFSRLPIVFIPHVLDVDGNPKMYTFKYPEESMTFIIGFQDQSNAVCCKNLMVTWSEKERLETAVIPMKPESLIKICENQSVEPIIFRKDTLPLEPGMTIDSFYQCAMILANVQKGNIPILNQENISNNDFET